MMSALPLLLAGAGAFSVFFALHVLLWRLKKEKGLLLIIRLSALAAAVTGAVMIAIFDVRWTDWFWVSLPVQAFLTLAYLHLYIGTFRSLSVRILGELYTAGGRMTAQELDRAYSKAFMFDSRLRTLQEHGWFHCRDGLYSCTAKGRFFARIIIVLRMIYGAKRAG